METGIHIGNKIDAKEAVGPIAKAVVDVLGAIHDYRIDRETALKALDVVGLAGQPQGTSVSYCNVTGGPPPQRQTIYGDDADDADGDA
jgi:hypothetical protein